MRLKLCISVLLLVALVPACSKDVTRCANPAGPSLAGPATANPQFVAKVEVIYHSYLDHDPEGGDWVTFWVHLADPDGTTRDCTLQSIAVRPYGSDCPTIGTPVEKIGPSTFRAYLYRVWVNMRPQDAKHRITAGEYIPDSPTFDSPFLETGNNLTIAGATDEEVKVVGSCSNCVYGQVQARLFRMEYR